MNTNNFSWIDKNVAGSAIPQSIDDINHYIKEGIAHVVSLTPERPLVFFHTDKIDDHHLAIYSIPSDQVVNKFIHLVRDILKRGEKMVIHCQFGQERTGIMIAIYLVEIKGMKLKAVIDLIRRKRPGSLQTYHSVNYLRNRYR